MSHSLHRIHALTALILTFGLPMSWALTGCDPPKTPPDVTLQTATAVAPDKLAPQTIEERARELTQRYLIVDGHIDLPFRLEMGRDEGGAVTEDVTQRTEKGNFDWVRARAGGLDAPFMSIYVPASYQKDGGAKAFAEKLIGLVEGIAEASPDKFAIPHNVADVQKAFAAKKVSLPLGMENGAPLEGKLENVAHFHKRGVRYITLTHSEDNDICDSSYADTHIHKGLSVFGKQVVAEMNRVGIMIDVSHISDDAFWQVMDLSKTPVIASHSSCRHFTPGFERNMSDDMIKRLAKSGGVIMINYGSTFITKVARQWSDDVKTAREAFMTSQGLEDRKDPKVKTWYEAYKADHPLPFANVTDVADHIEHVIKLVGVDHVGLGSDFDGVGDSLPVGLKDASELPNLVAELLRRGVSESDIAKICGINVMRVWAKVELFAASHH
jgi:membrane dipeptidase